MEQLSKNWAEHVSGRLKLRDLRLLQTVVECGSMAKAAASLGISHPVISKAVSGLEHLLGVPLLDRSARGVEATLYGQALLKCGTAVFDEVRQGLSRIELLHTQDVGELRIGCPEAISAGLLADVAEQFTRECGGARLLVAHADTASFQFDELRERKVDLLVGTISRPLAEDDLLIDALCEERFFVVAGPGSPWARRRRFRLRDLMGELWVLPPHDSVPGRRVAAVFAENNLPVPQSGIVGLSIHLTISLVATGRFIALLPGTIARLNAKRGLLKILPVSLPTHGVTVAILTLKNRTVSPLASKFVACAHHVADAVSKATLSV